MEEDKKEGEDDKPKVEDVGEDEDEDKADKDKKKKKTVKVNDCTKFLLFPLILASKTLQGIFIFVNFNDLSVENTAGNCTLCHLGYFCLLVCIWHSA